LRLPEYCHLSFKRLWLRKSALACRQKERRRR
jgi:hypothetical protein